MLVELNLYGEGQVLQDCLPAVYLFPRLKELTLELDETEGQLDLAVLQPLSALESLTCRNWEQIELSSSSSSALLPQLTCLRCLDIDNVSLPAAPPSLQHLVIYDAGSVHLTGEGLQLPQVSTLALHNIQTAAVSWQALPQLAILRATDCRELATLDGLSALGGLTSLTVGPIWDVVEAILQAAPPSLRELAIEGAVDDWQLQPPFHAMPHLTSLECCSLAVIPHLGCLAQLQHLEFPYQKATALTLEHIEWLCCLTSLQRIGFHIDSDGGAPLARRLQVRGWCFRNVREYCAQQGAQLPALMREGGCPKALDKCSKGDMGTSLKAYALKAIQARPRTPSARSACPFVLSLPFK